MSPNQKKIAVGIPGAVTDAQDLLDQQGLKDLPAQGAVPAQQDPWDLPDRKGCVVQRVIRDLWDSVDRKDRKGRREKLDRRDRLGL